MERDIGFCILLLLFFSKNIVKYNSDLIRLFLALGMTEFSFFSSI